MKRSISLAIFLLIAAPLVPEQKFPASCALQVMIGAGKSVTFTVPCMSHEQLGRILSEFIAQEHPDAQKRANELLKEAGELTLTITTRRTP